MKQIKEFLDWVDANRLYPDLMVIKGGAETEVAINGKKVLMFSSNNYLGLSTHPKVIRAAIDATKKYGVGSGGSRLLSGNMDIHRRLEERLTRFKGAEDAIIWPTGYSGNVGTISAVINLMKIGPASYLRRKSIVISDELNHASIIDGCALSKAKVAVYKHRDADDLKRKLKKYANRRKLVVTDAVFSMDGDIAPLDKIVPLCKKYGAMLMVDEAHSTGMLGKNGHGLIEHFGFKPVEDVDIVFGTCSKALGGIGGFVVGSKDLIKFLRIASRSYMFSAAMMPGCAAALIAALDLIEKEPRIREKMWENVNYLKEGFHQMGFDTLDSETQIVPIFIGAEQNAITFSRLLLEKGIYGPCVRWPAVEKEKARIRFTVMSTHSKQQLDHLLYSCRQAGQELRIIK
jgi:8-amino-7-oxononanoate synthase